MVAAGRIVLFHDTPPQGAGVPEVLQRGLGVAPGLVPLPHARRRLRLDLPARVALMARRFAPDLALALDDGARVVVQEGRIVAAVGASRLAPEGDVLSLEAA
jgi:hypothetical protein